MRTDRRGFLGTLAAGLAASAGRPALRPRAPDVYVNDALGLRFNKPRGWIYVDRLEWSLGWADVKYGSDLLEEDELKALLGGPLVVVAKADLDRTGVSPNVAVWVETGTDPTLPLRQAHEEYVDVSREILRDFRLLEPPEPAELGGAPASRMRLRYLAEAHSGEAATCEVEHYLVLRGPVFVGIGLGRAAEGHAPEALEELEGVGRSVVFG